MKRQSIFVFNELIRTLVANPEGLISPDGDTLDALRANASDYDGALIIDHSDDLGRPVRIVLSEHGIYLKSFFVGNKVNYLHLERKSENAPFSIIAIEGSEQFMEKNSSFKVGATVTLKGKLINEGRNSSFN